MTNKLESCPDAPALDRLSELACEVLDATKARGASQAEVNLNEDRGLSVVARLGEVETIEYTRDRGLSVTVYFGGRTASASTGDLDAASIAATLDQACAIARHTE
ncbi:MAG: metalloprotease PmbA, partial [Xanthomonadales bacterium]|nr:metalloprotease PmbA [Xanthomonadales bacterium]